MRSNEAGASIPMGWGACPPNIYEGGGRPSSEHKKLCPDPQGKWITATTVVSCILMQNCVVSQKASASGVLRPPDPLPGLHHWTPLGDVRPPDPQSSFMSPIIL